MLLPGYYNCSLSVTVTCTRCRPLFYPRIHSWHTLGAGGSWGPQPHAYPVACRPVHSVTGRSHFWSAIVRSNLPTRVGNGRSGKKGVICTAETLHLPLKTY